MSIMDLSVYIAEQIIIDEIMRSDMPQIKGKDYPDVLKIFKEYGVPYRLQNMNIDDLFPLQKDFIQSKVDNIVNTMNTDKDMQPIFISSDYYIIDGHHRWLANKHIKNPIMKVIKVGYPKNAALKLFDKLDEKLNEAVSKITKTVVIFPGRFQPFHRGHYYSYNDLVSKFGKNNIYIASSNVTGGDKSPFTFQDKKTIITKLFGIPGTKVVQVKNPYRPEEILKTFDPKTTAVIVAVGEKDANRLGGKYYVKYKGRVDEGYLDKGYVYIVPQLQLKIQGKTISGTEVRNNFSKELFKGLYPKYDDAIYNAMKQKLSEALILEGGAYGHLTHPFEDMDLTFGDLKTMISSALEGKLDLTQEKTDGQNLMFSWIDGKLKVARNASHTKNFGKGALDISGVSSMFSGRGEIQTAFTEAAKDLEAAVSKLSQKQKDKIFANGKKFMSVEVIYPQTTNVIPYDFSMLVFHGTFEYDENGNKIGADKTDASILAGMIKQVNADVQNTFKIRAPNNLKLPKVQNFSSQKSYFFSKLNKLQNEFKLKDSDTVLMYHQTWWENFVSKQAKSMKYGIPNDVLVDLTKRWAYNNKSYKINDIKKRIDNDTFRTWVDSFDKGSYTQQFKDNIKPFELLFLELGAQVLKNINVFLAVNPNDSIQKMKTSVDKAIKDIESSNDVNAMAKMKAQLERLNSIGGIDAVIPSEGITFMFNDKLYKFTGTFAPINSLLGILKYGN